MESITRLLEATRRGDVLAADRLFSAVNGELRILARSQWRRWQGNETINTTTLIHEAFIKLSGTESMNEYTNRTHFYATASKAMRQILINYAEQRRAGKRGSDAVRVEVDKVELITDATADELLQLEPLQLNATKRPA